MIIRKHSYVLDVDVEGTSKYSQEHEICDCNKDGFLFFIIYFSLSSHTLWADKINLK